MRGSSEGTVRGFDMEMGEWEKRPRRASQDLSETRRRGEERFKLGGN